MELGCRCHSQARLRDATVGRVAQYARATALDVLDGETQVKLLIFNGQGELVGRAKG